MRRPQTSEAFHSLIAETPLRILQAGLARASPVTNIPLHHHPFFQLEVVLMGRLFALFDGRDYEITSGMATFFRPFQNHGERPCSTNSIVDNIHIKFEAHVTWFPVLSLPSLSRFRAARKLKTIIRMWMAGNGLKKVIANIDLAKLFLDLAGQAPPARNGLPPNSLPRDSQWLAEVLARMDECLESPASVRDLALRLHLTPDHFARRFKERTGIQPHLYLMKARIERAKMLLNTGLSCKEIAARLGFCSTAHFTRSFKQICNVPPSAWLSHLGEPKGEPPKL